MDIEYINTAKEMGNIKFIRYAENNMPTVYQKENDDKLIVDVYDILLGKNLQLPADIVVVTPAYQGAVGTDKLKELLKIPTGQDEFFQESHIKLKPLEFATDGIYLCGCARAPKPIRETIEEALGAAMKACIPMRRGYVEAEGIVAEIDLQKCTSCGLCAKTCAFNAIKLVEKMPQLIKALCKGCGTCAAECPKAAIDIIHYRAAQILAQLEAALAVQPEKILIAFCCHWCALGAVDLAGVSRLEYPTNLRIIRVLCSGRVTTTFIEHAFTLGAAGVLIAGCEFPTCHYIIGNYKCKTRLEKLEKKLIERGVDPRRLRTLWLSAADSTKFVNTVQYMVRQLGL
jgi:heterodisulfide reductase subunit A